MTQKPERREWLSMWRIWSAIALLLASHILIYNVTAHTPYAICLSKLTVYGPAERERLLARFAEQHGFGAGECCDLDKNAGEFRLTYRNYLESGVIWTVDARGSSSGKQKHGFLTNCGEILTEREYFEKYLL
jgi:hypothetical protein